MARTLVLAMAALVALALPAPALASRNQEMILHDDIKVVYAASDEELRETLKEIKALGTDRLRVLVFWNLIAPNPRSEQRPDFGERGPADPRSYPESNWRRYDRIVRIAEELDLGLLFNVSGPGPGWADQGRRGRKGIRRPNAGEFRAFVEAVGKRYSGTWPAIEGAPAPEPSPSPVPTLPGQTTTTVAAPPVPRIPRVEYWSIWNEPGHPGWLMPQWTGRKPVTPHLYRGLVDAARDGLDASGHGDDTILIGETHRFGEARGRPTPTASVDTLRFVRELYCVSARYRPLRGRAARSRGCPATSSGRRRFVAQNPGLFNPSGFAHHPYTIDQRPNWRGNGRADTPLGAISRVGRALDRAQRGWRRFKRLPLWITEFGYQTPPDPFRAVGFDRQAAWNSWGEFVAFRNPRVVSYAQFLLNDDGPVLRHRPRTRRRWVTWQSGLKDQQGNAKPALAEYRVPIFVSPELPRSRRVRVFGTYRPAASSVDVPAQIQFLGEGGWQTLRSLNASGSRGYLSTVVRLPRPGRVRILYSPVGGKPLGTRAALVKRRR